MKYIFFRDTDITLAQYNELRVNKTPLTISTMEHGWIMLRADDDGYQPEFPHVDIEHVYTTFIKMPAGPKSEVRIESTITNTGVKSMPECVRLSEKDRRIETNETLAQYNAQYPEATKATAREVGYFDYCKDRKDGLEPSTNPYRDPTLAREWESGREQARIEFDPAVPGDLTEARPWEKEFREGVRAANKLKRGKTAPINHHVKGTPAYKAWGDGFRSVENGVEIGLPEDPVENEEKPLTIKEVAFLKGEEAFKNGKPVEANPFKKGGDQWAGYVDGWETARDSESPTDPSDAPGFVPGGHIDKSAFEGGVIAAKTGYGLQANPFVAKSDDWKSWREGWSSVTEKPAKI